MFFELKTRKRSPAPKKYMVLAVREMVDIIVYFYFKDARMHTKESQCAFFFSCNMHICVYV